MSACHDASAPTIAGVTFAAIVAVITLAVRVIGWYARWDQTVAGSCIACFKADLAAKGQRIGARRGAFLDVIVEPYELVAALSAPRAVAEAR